MSYRRDLDSLSPQALDRAAADYWANRARNADPICRTCKQGYVVASLARDCEQRHATASQPA